MYAFDSNTLIYHLNDVFPADVFARVDEWIKEGVFVSVVSRIEVLGYPQDESEEQEAQRVLALLVEVPLNEAVIQQTIALRRRYRIKLPHAIIAATALYREVPLVTRNIADFNTIDDLALVNPFD